MSLIGLFEQLREDPSYRSIVAGRSIVTDIEPAIALEDISTPESAKPYLISTLWHDLKVPMLVVVSRPEDARRLHDQVLSYLGETDQVHLFPEPEVLPFERLVADAGTNNQRMRALASLLRFGSTSNHAGLAPLLIASVSGAMRKTLPQTNLGKAWHVLKVGDRVGLGELFSRWVDLGYQRENGVEVPGSFSHRGGIVDVYPPSSSLPVRLELFGDEIESIRLFDPGSQRSVTPLDSIDILPAREVLPSLADEDRVSDLISQLNFSLCTATVTERFEEELASLFSGRDVEALPFYNGLINQGSLLEHLPQGSLILLDGPADIESEALDQAEKAHQLRAIRESRGELPTNFPSSQLTWDEFHRELNSRPRLMMNGSGGEEGTFDFRLPSPYNGRIETLASDLREMQRAGRRVVVVSRHTRRLSEVLEEQGMGTTVLSTLDSSPPPGSLTLVNGHLREGWTFYSKGGGLTLLSDSEVFGTAKERRSKARTPVKRESFLSELVPGGYVVHIDHGVARFAGTVPMESDGEDKEYLVLEYAERDKLYVPTEHLDRVSPYMAPNDQVPSLSRLGTQEWSRLKERAKKSARELARELLDLYASRQVAEGHAFSKDSPWQLELEDSFPFEETEDQARTIVEVKREMEGSRPMDRLVCGDVGYGKTEIALRAAFKTVADGMQVAMLVPTTVLAQQHYATFTERLSPFPVRVEVLSRFRTRKEQQEIVERLKLGTADIVIGTHRLLQKDVTFKNLGLVVVDEEQRFGVAHKETLKRMRREVDMLTLSATPIPRTLYMGLSGIRDMSTMETPPEERLPVKTYVSEYSDDVVKEAVQRELERGGQVFLLHNRVQTIGRVAADLAKMVPEARIGIGHGRMNESELEEVMVAFGQGEVDVLVCTTIIESGLDIPNANTLIIDRADRFGLSQLYQLRGRVGRAGQRAYTYLLTPRRSRITETATKRLKAILEASELGAGFRIATRDLEIRGAGNVLGAEQSGHIHAVGFELYTQLLNEAVAEVKAGMGYTNGAEQAKAQVRVNLQLSAQIPDSYVPHLPTRLAIYQRMTKLRERKEVGDIEEELRDRFGSLPQTVNNLLYLVDLKLLAGDAGVESVTQSGSTITLGLFEAVGGAAVPLERALGPNVRVGNQQVHLSIRRSEDGWRGSLVSVLERLLAFKEQLPSEAVAG